MQMVKMPIYTAQHIRIIEEIAQTRYSISSSLLMQRAGKAAFDFLVRRWPNVRHLAVFCGTGNNGGDGYVIAKLARDRGLGVTIWQVGYQSKSSINLSNAAEVALQACIDAHIPILPLSDVHHAVRHSSSSEMDHVSGHHSASDIHHADRHHLPHPDLIVDAICGIGLHGQLQDPVMEAIDYIKRLNAPVFSIDVPTGVDADHGVILGAAVEAQATMTFIGLKLGLLTGEGISYTGELVVSDLQLPSELIASVEPIAEKMQIAHGLPYLKPRLRHWHKGLSGHVLVIGGGIGYAGAPLMASLAALRVGAGLVSVATHPHHAAFMSVNCPEVMCHPIADPHQLAPLLEKATVIVLGPGLTQSAWGKSLWEYVLQSPLPKVIDADALNFMAADTMAANMNTTSSFLSAIQHRDWILTPHPGEASRLLKQSIALVQADRLKAVKKLQKSYGGCVVLKGAGTLIASPDELPVLCDKGNPGMATPGMGDVLSGVMGGLLAQGLALSEAATLGVYLHAIAGDQAAKEGERGMIATDLMPYLRRLVGSH